MSLTLLFDLDDTLLDTNVPVFAPAYFKALASQPFKGISMEKFAPAMHEGKRLMNENADPSRTMQDVFESYFYPALNISKDSVKDEVENFYDVIFPTLGNLTSSRPEAIDFMNWAFSKGYRVAIATDPLLPRKAMNQRLQWAGFDSRQFELVSSFEEFHFSKTFPEYYAEILGRLGWPQGPILMIGNDLERDIAPAKKLGLATFHLISNQTQRSHNEANQQGTYSDLRNWLETINPKTLEPNLDSLDAYVAILTSTPAALSSLMKIAPSMEIRPDPDEWAFVEVLCHFRDTEQEINLEQLNMVLKNHDPFLSAPYTHDWAEEREYIKQNPNNALSEFTKTRLEVLRIIKGLTQEELTLRARHAIFGPTIIRELIAFMVEHDRLHLHQIWKILNP